MNNLRQHVITHFLPNEIKALSNNGPEASIPGILNEDELILFYHSFEEEIWEESRNVVAWDKAHKSVISLLSEIYETCGIEINNPLELKRALTYMAIEHICDEILSVNDLAHKAMKKGPTYG